MKKPIKETSPYPFQHIATEYGDITDYFLHGTLLQLGMFYSYTIETFHDFNLFIVKLNIGNEEVHSGKRRYVLEVKSLFYVQSLPNVNDIYKSIVEAVSQIKNHSFTLDDDMAKGFDSLIPAPLDFLLEDLRVLVNDFKTLEYN